MDEKIQEIYGNRVRIRVCGLLVEEGNLLMVNHHSLAIGDFWSPPGGGINFGETAIACLEREFREETGLEITVGDFLFACEFIQPPLHGVELYFKVSFEKGALKRGYDPELKAEDQTIREVKFQSWTHLQLMPSEVLHGMFQLVSEPADILQLKGYISL